MVVTRFGKVDQSQQPQERTVLHQRNHHQTVQSTTMFKVPQIFSVEQQTGKRKWPDAFQRGDSSSSPANTSLGLMPAQQKQKRTSAAEATPPLTIFYAGAVNVYDNVPESMVRALMTLAAAKSSKPGTAMLNQLRTNATNFNTLNTSAFGFPSLQQQQQQQQQKQQQSLNPFTTSSKNNININNGQSTSAASDFAFASAAKDNTSLSLSSFHNITTEEKKSVVVPSVPAAAPAVTQPSTSSAAASVQTPVMDLLKSPRTRMQLLPSGLPQARRASIQRFLEKRKQK